MQVRDHVFLCKIIFSVSNMRDRLYCRTGGGGGAGLEKNPRIIPQASFDVYSRPDKHKIHSPLSTMTRERGRDSGRQRHTTSTKSRSRSRDHVRESNYSPASLQEEVNHLRRIISGKDATISAMRTNLNQLADDKELLEEELHSLQSQHERTCSEISSVSSLMRSNLNELRTQLAGEQEKNKILENALRGNQPRTTTWNDTQDNTSQYRDATDNRDGTKLMGPIRQGSHQRNRQAYRSCVSHS